MQVDFYHLTTTPLDRALPQIAEKVLASGARLLLVADSAAQRAALDKLLWTYNAESFLPHGCAGGAADERQPVLISEERSPPTARAMWRLPTVSGAMQRSASIVPFISSMTNGSPRRAPREKALAGRDAIERRYWKQNEAGRWEQAA